MTSAKDDLILGEDEAFADLWSLVASLTPEQREVVGVQEDRSVKDLMAHVACWMAETAQALQQIRLGTYRGWDHDEEEVDRACYEAFRDLSHDDVVVQLHASRARMLQEWEALPEDLVTDDAVSWFRGWGMTHYREHLPRLREWIGDLRGRS